MAQIFPKWSNSIIKWIVALFFISGLFVLFGIWYWLSPWNLDVGYQPNQPIEYKHSLHVGRLGIDCRYCHHSVEKSSVAGVPSTQICMNCHKTVLPDSLKLTKVVESWRSDKPIEWNRIYDLPDYVYFDHSAHVTSGIGCVSCHGRVDLMDKVSLNKPLSMFWCLECHRSPEKHLRPLDKITDMTWSSDKEWKEWAKIKVKEIDPPTIGCSGCHR